MKKAILFFTLFVLSLKMTGQTGKTYTLEEIQDSISGQLNAFPQEKLHLHIDRNYYIPGEKIWFKAYVLDAITNQAPTYSSYVYVELINSADSLIERVMVHKGEDNMYYGHLFLSEIVEEGFYTVRAYTRFMENLGDGYFFKTHIRIGNLSDGSEGTKKKERKKQPKDDYDVSFFPEGGNLLEDAFCKVAFKALNKNGFSDEISGVIVDEEDTVLCETQMNYAGMGTFAFMPKKGKKYFLKCRNRNGLEKKFQLPATVNAYSICASWRNNNHFITVKKSENCPERPLYLLVHNKGIVLYFASWNFQKEYLSFSKNMFPSGVLQILLFDENMNPLSERLIFNKNEEYAKIAFTTDKPGYKKRELVTPALSITDAEGNMLTGNISVAVTDDADIVPDTLNTILSSLLLSSELKGFIESPGYYIQENKNAEMALELLMMTHGWRRYNIPEAIKGKYETPKILFENAKSITGTVKSLFMGKPVIGGEIILLSLDGGMGGSKTDSTGHFGFYDLDYPDSVRFMIQAKNQKGSGRVELFLDRETFPDLKRAVTGRELSLGEGDSTGMDEFIKKAELRAKFDDDIRVIHLEEVKVTAKRTNKQDEARLSYWANASSDVTVRRDDIEKRHIRSMNMLLMNIPGVMVTGNGNVSIRGASGPPLYLIDGSEFDASVTPLDMLEIDDVESVDVFKGASAAIFGSRGGNGVISITTRRGEINSTRKANFNFAAYRPIGSQKPVEFYSPKYDTPAAKNADTPDYRTTIFWKPDIVISEGGKASFEFYTSDFPTTYSVVIEGLSDDGTIIRKVEKIEVKE